MSRPLPRSALSIARSTIATALAVAAIAGGAFAAPAAFERMLALAFRAPELAGTVRITRSDPFGGPDEHVDGRVWYVPGRGLRFRTEGEAGEDMLLDRNLGAFLLYRRADRTLYRAPWDRAPVKLRQLVSEPQRFLDADFRAVAERRAVGGVMRSGFRVRRASLGDSLPAISAWVAPDPRSGLPRWLTAYTEEDSIRIEFRDLAALSVARTADLRLRVPRGTPEQPLDPRGLLEGRESR